MVKNLADELADILDWNENPGLGENAVEQARAGIVIFCRGLVCGLRFGQQVTGDTPISVDEEKRRRRERVQEAADNLHDAGRL